MAVVISLIFHPLSGGKLANYGRRDARRICPRGSDNWRVYGRVIEEIW